MEGSEGMTEDGKLTLCNSIQVGSNSRGGRYGNVTRPAGSEKGRCAAAGNAADSVSCGDVVTRVPDDLQSMRRGEVGSEHGS